MHDAKARACRQTARRLGGTKRILDLAQMSDHGDVEARLAPDAAATQRRRRLLHDANLVPKVSRHALSREFLQRDEPVGTGERAQDRGWIATDVFVDVGAAQADDQRSTGVTFVKASDAVCAAPGMKCNH
jgi:hypothetical protein